MVPGIQLRRLDKSIPPPPDWARHRSLAHSYPVPLPPYSKLVGSLMYIACGSRPDITYSASRLASYLEYFLPAHWEAALRVLRYLKGTCSHALVLGGLAPLTLTRFFYSDYANCPDTSRSVGRHCFSLGSGLIFWSSRKQRSVANRPIPLATPNTLPYMKPVAKPPSSENCFPLSISSPLFLPPFTATASLLLCSLKTMCGICVPNTFV